MRSSSGYTLIELLVVLAILMLIAVLSFSTYMSLKSHKTLDTGAAIIASELAEARSLTLSGKNGDQWGVHLASSSVTLFDGPSYSVGASGNAITALDSALVVAVISLSGSGRDVVFQRLTGETAQNGFITLSLTASSTQSKTITIYQTGLTSTQ